MQSLPKELLDAGRIDGCTEYGISVKIMMPITKPAFASMAILCAMGSWNNMLWPMLVFRDTSKFTLQIGLNTLLTPYGNNYNLLIAGSMFGILPILIIYLIFQRYLIDGMTSGAVKGWSKVVSIWIIIYWYDKKWAVPLSFEINVTVTGDHLTLLMRQLK